MPLIRTEIYIKAPIEICFNLSRSIDLHKISTSNTKEEAIDGVTTGLINLNETVTWRAKHLGFWQNLTTRITEFDFPNYFADEMIEGAFHSFKHEHHFKRNGDFTLMKDCFMYRSPLGLLGKLADTMFLKEYMKKLLIQRNLIIKEHAETDGWKQFL